MDIGAIAAIAAMQLRNDIIVIERYNIAMKASSVGEPLFYFQLDFKPTG